MTYQETIKYLESFINYEKLPVYPYKESLKLERVRDFLSTIGNPQESLRCIHVAGSKGKGSTCAFITYILRQAGYKVGLYTSPHLLDFRERIRVLNYRLPITDYRLPKEFEGMISKAQLTMLTEKLKPAISVYNKNSKCGPLSFFEVYTALALVYFKEQKVDFAVLETGLGGRLDATNVVNPLVCAITPISYEHTQKLGNTLKEIAAEKAGIIKMGYVPRPPIVISAPQEEEALEVIRNRCKEMDAKLYEAGKDITYKKTKAGFEVKGILEEYVDLKTRLVGEHQLVNASVAIGAIEALRSNGVNVGSGSIKEGLYNTVWPGRCEVVSKSPSVILDGAQNKASVCVLKKTIKDNFKYNRLILVLGISNDKDIKGICNELNYLAGEIILTKANNPRAIEPQILCSYFNGKSIHITAGVQEAKDVVVRIAGKRDLVLVTGSLFVVGEMREILKPQDFSRL